MYFKLNLKESKLNFLRKVEILKQQIGLREVLLGFLFLLILGLIAFRFRSQEKWVRVETRIVSTTPYMIYSGDAPPYWLTESVKVGDVEYDSQGKSIAEVVKVNKMEFGGSSKDVYLTLNLRVSKNRRTGKLEFKYKPLEIGRPLELHLSNSYVYGLVTYVEGLEDSRVYKELIIDGAWFNVYPWMADAIPVGGKMTGESGEAIAEILEKRVELHSLTVFTDVGKPVIARDPQRRDVFLKIKIKVKEQGGITYFYEYKKARVGEGISIYLKEVDIYPVITAVYDLDGKKIY